MKQDRHLHICEEVGGGTYFDEYEETSYSEVDYECKCGLGIRILYTTDLYIKRKYPKKIIIDKIRLSN